MKCKIESPSTKGCIPSMGTKVSVDTGDGWQELTDITDITVRYPLNGLVNATVEFYVSPVTIEANLLLGLSTIEEAAKEYGYRLVPEGEGGSKV